ncbi:MAG: alginate export family protein [Bacteroidota bacterium]
MKKILLFICFSGFIFAFVGDIIAQSVNVSAEIRPRFEYRHGYKTLFPDDANPASFISQRTRLNGFFANQNFKAYVSLQDVRVWGDVKQLNARDVNGFSVHQAWGQIFFGENVYLKIGRQEIIYDDHRIFGSVNWAQQARSHDAAILGLKFGGKHKIDVGIAYNAMGESLYKLQYENKNYKTFQLIHYHVNFGNSGLSILFLNNGMAYDAADTSEIYDEQVAYSQTIGGRFSHKAENFKFNLAAYYQGGKNAANHDLAAMYFGGDISLHLIENFSFGLGFEYLSGTSTVDQGDPDMKDQSFTPLYGTNHKFNGWMDYFYVGNGHGNVGLIDIYLPMKYTYEKLTFALIPHYFMSAATVSMPNQDDGTLEDLSSGLGTEVDFSVTYAAAKNVTIGAGYSTMFATETMRAVKQPAHYYGDNYNNSNGAGWIMVTFKPTFFSQD